jgi:hypothetical protein
MPQTRLSPQLGFPKSRNSVNTNRVVASSSSSQAKIKRLTTSASSALCGISIARSTQRLKTSLHGSECPSQIKSMDSPLTNPSTIPISCNAGQLASAPSTRIRGLGLDLYQFSTAFQKLSVDERMFILHIYNWGLIQAKRIAALSGYKLQRPLPELLAMTSELDKNYSARSAKRKRS